MAPHEVYRAAACGVGGFEQRADRRDGLSRPSVHSSVRLKKSGSDDEVGVEHHDHAVMGIFESEISQSVKLKDASLRGKDDDMIDAGLLTESLEDQDRVIVGIVVCKDPTRRRLDLIV
jgi:hypothetical protein